MDEARLDDLLSVAGDDNARELLDRLTEDLSSIRDRLPPVSRRGPCR
jgi:hypothetical protein